MTIFNTTSPRQSGNDNDYRGSYTRHLTLKQFEMLMAYIDRTESDADALWEAFFDEDYKAENWANISINAAAELINALVNIDKTNRALAAFARKMTRTEQEQHDYEMGW